MGNSTKINTAKPLPPMALDRHVLYSAAVQSTDAELGFAERIYRNKRGKLPRLLREDFCGSALLSVDWVNRREGNEAWGVDLDLPTLEWGRKHYLERMETGAEKVHLIHDNVLTAKTPKADLVMALNFSYFIFKKRAELKAYLASACKALKPDGVLVLDIYGGTSVSRPCWEERQIRDGVTPDGDTLPSFKFAWEHESYNAVTGELMAHINFKHRTKPWMRKVFTYDWRIWTLPEMREVLEDAGFSSSEVFSHGWDEHGESDGNYRRRTKIINEEGWLGYIGAYK